MDKTSQLTDLTVKCKDCQEDFTVTVDEQQRLIELAERKKWEYVAPKRCKDCRQKRRDEKNKGRDRHEDRQEERY